MKRNRMEGALLNHQTETAIEMLKHHLQTTAAMRKQGNAHDNDECEGQRTRRANNGKVLKWIEHTRQEDSGILAIHKYG
jgi:hypothetical protein